MSIYIKKFATVSGYTAAVEEGLVLPNISLVAETGIMYYNPASTPSHDYSQDYFTLVAVDDCTFEISSNYEGGVQYSIDNGNTWSEQIGGEPVEVDILSGNKILLKGNIPLLSGSCGSPRPYNSNSRYNIEGNIFSLFYGDNFVGVESVPDSAFFDFFAHDEYLLNAEHLSLPATTLAKNCYINMFQDCTSLTTAPELPATTLANGCYYNMFKGCTSLTTAPNELPATTLANSCYSYMFKDCTSLTTAPELPATTLADSCYSYMFQGCTSLTTAPELPATTLAENCYIGMFCDCTSLTTAPELPATTLAENCYIGMFYECTSLTTAPELPATTLANGCYDSMFYGCTSLNYIKAMFTTTPGSSYTGNWVSNVASNGTFVKNSAATWTNTGVNAIPTGWTVETASA